MNIPPYALSILKNSKIEYVIQLILLFILVLDIFDVSFPPAAIIMFSTAAISVYLVGHAIRFQLMDNNAPRWAKLFNLFHHYGLSILYVGILFAVQDYPGTSLMMNVGVGGLLLSVALLFVPDVQDTYQQWLKQILLRLAVGIAWTLYVLL